MSQPLSRLKYLPLILATASSGAIAAVPNTFSAGGAIVASEVNENFNNLDGRATTLESEATSLDSRATALETKATALETADDALDARLTTLEGGAGPLPDVSVNCTANAGALAAMTIESNTTYNPDRYV